MKKVVIIISAVLLVSIILNIIQFAGKSKAEDVNGQANPIVQNNPASVPKVETKDLNELTAIMKLNLEKSVAMKYWAKFDFIKKLATEEKAAKTVAELNIIINEMDQILSRTMEKSGQQTDLQRQKQPVLDPAKRRQELKDALLQMQREGEK